MEFLSLFEARVVGFPKDYGNFVIMVGGSGSGKTAAQTLINLPDWKDMNSDRWVEIFARKSGGSLSDPKLTHQLHDIFKHPAKRFLKGFMTHQQNFAKELPNIVWETTGKSLMKVGETAELARKAGYTVTSVFCDVPVSLAIERNSKRSRVVPQHVVIAAHKQVAENRQGIIDVSDISWEIQNDVPFAAHRSSRYIRRLK